MLKRAHKKVKVGKVKLWEVVDQLVNLCVWIA